VPASNAGVPIHVAMRYMGHKTPRMFLHYAQTLAEVAEKEFLRYKKITAGGGEYQRDPAEMFEALALDKRTDRVLPNGWCTLPPRQTCDKGNACCLQEICHRRDLRRRPCPAARGHNDADRAAPAGARSTLR
jgi:hypothetical protein